VKISSPDYRGQDIDKAIDDFKMRIHNYETQYEAIDDTLDANLSFIKIFNQGEKYLVNRVCGEWIGEKYLVSRVCGELIGEKYLVDRVCGEWIVEKYLVNRVCAEWIG